MQMLMDKIRSLKRYVFISICNSGND